VNAFLEVNEVFTMAVFYKKCLPYARKKDVKKVGPAIHVAVMAHRTPIF
jgi:hypothetical protein